MGRSTKPRRKYDAGRWLQHAFTANEQRLDAKPLSEQHQTEIALGHHLSFEALMRYPDEAHWYDLCGNLNMALILCERGFGAEYLGDIKASMIGMMRAMRRAEKTGSYELDADAIRSLKVALEVHDQQLAVVERSELRKAAQTIVGRVKRGDVYADFQLEVA